MTRLLRTSTAIGLIVALALPGMGAAGEGSPVAVVDPLSVIAEIAKQGTLGLLCIVVLWSYRRDFFRKNEDKDRELAERRAEKDRLEVVLERSSTAIAAATAAMARQTDATHRLSRSVEKLEEKFG